MSDDNRKKSEENRKNRKQLLQKFNTAKAEREAAKTKMASEGKKLVDSLAENGKKKNVTEASKEDLDKAKEATKKASDDHKKIEANVTKMEEDAKKMEEDAKKMEEDAKKLRSDIKKAKDTDLKRAKDTLDGVEASEEQALKKWKEAKADEDSHAIKTVMSCALNSNKATMDHSKKVQTMSKLHRDLVKADIVACKDKAERMEQDGFDEYAAKAKRTREDLFKGLQDNVDSHPLDLD